MNLEKSQEFSRAVVKELKRIRLKKSLSQLAVSQKAGLSRAAIQHIEKGIRNPTLMVVHAIAKALDTSLTKIIRKVETKTHNLIPYKVAQRRSAEGEWYMNTLGKRLRTLRESVGLSGAELSRRLQRDGWDALSW